LKQFTAALKLYDRMLDIKPNDPELMAYKAGIYQAQGNLQEAARILSGINETSSKFTFGTKTSQLQLERNYGELIRGLEARLAQFHFDLDPNLGLAAPSEKAFIQFQLALTQRLAGDTAGAKVTAEPARNTFDSLYRKHP